MFLDSAGTRYRVLRQQAEGTWLICYDKPAAPSFVSSAVLERYQRIQTPDETLEGTPSTKTAAEEKRLLLIQPLISDEGCMTDREKRRLLAKRQAQEYNTTSRRVLRIYYRWLASGSVSAPPKQGKSRMMEDVKTLYDEAIETYYFSSAQRSLRDAYDCMLLAHYVDGTGKLAENHPSWHSFRQYYYRQGCTRGAAKPSPAADCRCTSEMEGSTTAPVQPGRTRSATTRWMPPKGTSIWYPALTPPW